MIQRAKVADPGELKDLKTEHLGTLSAPLDAYWEEALIGFADHYELRIDGARAGFYCLDSANHLVAFHLSKEHLHRAHEAFVLVVGEHGVEVALAGTHDPLFLSSCLDIAAGVRVHTLLFEGGCSSAEGAASEDLEGFTELSFERAHEDDFDVVLEHYVATSDSMDAESIESGFANLRNYVHSVMTGHRLFVLRGDGALLATSECRFSATQKPYADVGMIVAKAHRRKGVGSYILARTKDFCLQRDKLPICSCEVGNIGSQKAIARAGFVSQHRVVRVELRL